MSKLRILDASGDTVTEWDVETGTGLAEATQLFTDMVKAGYLAYAIQGEAKSKVITYDFKPEADEIVMTPLLRGG